MKSLTLQFVVGISSCLGIVGGQWVLDNRCRRRRDLSQLKFSHSTGVSPVHDSAARIKSSSPGVSNNSTDESHDHWYNGLRGHSIALPAPTRSQSDRNLVEEDPTSFMMRLHWQEGNCWQGVNSEPSKPKRDTPSLTCQRFYV